MTNGRARLELARTQAALTGVHVDVGGGAIDGSATATFGDLRDARRTLALTSAFTAQHAGFNVANLFRGQIDGTLDVTKPQGDIPTVGGTLVLSKSRLPLAALIPHAPANTNEHVPPTVAFAMNLQLGSDFRVQGPGVDIGANGAVAVSGNLAHPELDGRVSSTNGTLSFYRTFVLHQGSVVFHPEDGLIPDVDATATTHITNPDTDILLHVTGPATNLNLDLASNPSSTRNRSSACSSTRKRSARCRAWKPRAAAAASTRAASPAVSSVKTARKICLEPVGSSLGQSLGFEDSRARLRFRQRALGRRAQAGEQELYATFNQDFGGDDRQSIALNYTLPRNAQIALTAYNAGNQTPSILHTQQLSQHPGRRTTRCKPSNRRPASPAWCSPTSANSGSAPCVTLSLPKGGPRSLDNRTYVQIYRAPMPVDSAFSALREALDQRHRDASAAAFTLGEDEVLRTGFGDSTASSRTLPRGTIAALEGAQFRPQRAGRTPPGGGDRPRPRRADRQRSLPARARRGRRAARTAAVCTGHRSARGGARRRHRAALGCLLRRRDPRAAQRPRHRLARRRGHGSRASRTARTRCSSRSASKRRRAALLRLGPARDDDRARALNSASGHLCELAGYDIRAGPFARTQTRRTRCQHDHHVPRQFEDRPKLVAVRERELVHERPKLRVVSTA